jgi:hypothetical protein
MNLTYKTLTCKYCGHTYPFKGKANRVQCPKCHRFFQQEYKKQKKLQKAEKVADDFKDDIMLGNISEAMDKAKIDPFDNNKTLSSDFIMLLLKDDKLKFAFSYYCLEKKKKPLDVIKKAVIDFLGNEDYYHHEGKK